MLSGDQSGLLDPTSRHELGQRARLSNDMLRCAIVFAKRLSVTQLYACVFGTDTHTPLLSRHSALYATSL